MSEARTPVDAWQSLRRFTQARLALGRSGSGMPTAPWLAFSLAHAQARDAVHAPLPTAPLHAGLRELGLAPVEVVSAAVDRDSYLQRPDLGRRLGDGAATRLRRLGVRPGGVLLVLADGLSSVAVARHALPTVRALLPRLGRTQIDAVVALQARVALGDAIGEVLASRLALVLIGERPGLSATDSLGAYLTWQPRSGRTDAERNCVSNIRPDGLDYAGAAARIAGLVAGAQRLRASGVALEDESDAYGSLAADGPDPPPPVDSS